MKTDANNLRHRIYYGNWRVSENDEGRLVRSFCNKGVCWANIHLLPLTPCLPFGGSNERHRRPVKTLYKISVRKNALTGVQLKKINVVMWKRKILINSFGFSDDPGSPTIEGIFYDNDQEQYND